MRSLTSSPYLKATEAVRQHPRSFFQENIGHAKCHNGSLFRGLSSHSSGYEAKVDGRARLSKLWVPTGGIAASSAEDPHVKLVRAGFLRQAHSGIFHMLPLGRRVQDKLEALIDKYMFQLGASKVALSSISSQELWTKSGRLEKAGSELFQFRDRKNVRYLLSPTHEEEITSLVSTAVKSYKELPIRLYQISRKYRDERRPRHGLLRSREFIMKDLYTFDLTSSKALATYDQVREVYARLFDELKLPYLVAEADSGNMGGNLSHEFHFPTSKGEDHIISCSSCDYVANEELAKSTVPVPSSRADGSISRSMNRVLDQPEAKMRVWRGISRDRRTLVNVWYPSTIFSVLSPAMIPEVNLHAVKTIFSDLDASVEDPLLFWNTIKNTPGEDKSAGTVPMRLLNLVDGRLPDIAWSKISTKESRIPIWPTSIEVPPPEVDILWISKDPSTHQPLNLLRIVDGDPCSRCSNGNLRVQRAIELGHTFHLGTRYSDTLSATVNVPTESSNALGNEVSASNDVPMQMGCHGIGVSRMIGAVADTLADDKGLNWPRVMAPFEVVIVPGKGLDEAALQVYDVLQAPTGPGTCQLDMILDDRVESFPWKMQDADLVGYPVIIVVGRRWKAENICEVQCRRLKFRQEVPLGELPELVRSVLARL